MCEVDYRFYRPRLHYKFTVFTSYIGLVRIAKGIGTKYVQGHRCRFQGLMLVNLAYLKYFPV